MLKNTQINRAVTRKIATALGNLNELVVYVSGAVVSLYIDDPSAEDVRPTKDIDLTMEIASFAELESLRETLIGLGFIQTAFDQVACRFRYDDILVDVMSTIPVGWAPGNRWFKQGFEYANSFDLDGLKIRLLPLPYFLATKFDAFFDRGIKDLFPSHDYEDIVYLFNHCSDISQPVLNAEIKVKSYLIDCVTKILGDRNLKEAIIGSLFYEDQELHFDLILKKMATIAKGI